LPKREGRDLAGVLARKAAGDEAALEKLAGDPDIPDDGDRALDRQHVVQLVRELRSWADSKGTGGA